VRTAAAAVPATSTPLATPTAPARPDLAGTWRGAYVDASGKPLLRVVSLSISRVRDDGGIEGTLQYQARVLASASSTRAAAPIRRASSIRS
jgi:hypothetical protein